MPVIPKKGADKLGFSVLVSLTSVWGEIMEKLIRDSADKNRGSRGVQFILLNIWETQMKKLILSVSVL